LPTTSTTSTTDTSSTTTTQAKATTTKCTGDASTCVKSACCDNVPKNIVKGSVSFEVTLPSNVNQSQFLNDAKVKTGVQKGVAKKLGVDHTWVAVTLTDGRRLSASRVLAATKANIKVDFTVTVPAGTTGATSATKLQFALKSSNANSAAEKIAWANNVVTEIKAASPTTYANVTVETKNVVHVAVTAAAPNSQAPTRSPNPTETANGSVGIGANIATGMWVPLLVIMAIGLADMAPWDSMRTSA